MPALELREGVGAALNRTFEVLKAWCPACEKHCEAALNRTFEVLKADFEDVEADGKTALNRTFEVLKAFTQP